MKNFLKVINDNSYLIFIVLVYDLINIILGLISLFTNDFKIILEKQDIMEILEIIVKVIIVLYIYLILKRLNKLENNNKVLDNNKIIIDYLTTEVFIIKNIMIAKFQKADNYLEIFNKEIEEKKIELCKKYDKTPKEIDEIFDNLIKLK